jgi:MFS family permease
MSTLPHTYASPPVAIEESQQALFKKIAWRLMPFLFICYLIAQVDRMNVSFAKLQMLDELKFSETIYGLAAGVFFIGYVLFEVPSNILLRKYGAHRWIARIMVSWGIVTVGMMFVTTPMQFYVMRFLLGVAEAGFFPGVIFYLTYWFPKAQRTKMTAIFMTAIALSGVIVGPISGAIMREMHQLHGLSGWQWLFMLEGAPAVILGICCLFYLPRDPQSSRWLTDNEKAMLAEVMAKETASSSDIPLREILKGSKVWLLSGIYGCYGVSFFGFVFWLPTIIKSIGLSDPLSIGLVSSIPWTVAVTAMFLVASYVDKRQNAAQVLIVLSLIASLGWVLSPLVDGNIVLSMTVLSLAMFGLMASLPVFWNLPTSAYHGTSAAAVIAIVTSLGNVPGFFSPYIVGWIKETTHSMSAAMYMFAALSLIGAVLLVIYRKVVAVENK